MEFQSRYLILARISYICNNFTNYRPSFSTLDLQSRVDCIANEIEVNSYRTKREWQRKVW